MAEIAVIVAHPDDEVLGFGGAIARHAAAGDAVHILILATGLAARSSQSAPDPADLASLRSNATAAAAVLGARDVEFADFPDNRMDTVPILDVVQTIEAYLDRVEPTTVYTHYDGDLNIDHQIVSRAVLTACRPLPGAGIREILAGEVNSSTEWSHPDHGFLPTEYVDISDQLVTKIKALECYQGELRDWPHPRSAQGLEALGRWRGSQMGLAAAEAFKLIRRIR